MRAVISYEKKLNFSSARLPKAPKLNQEQEMKRQSILRSFSIAKNVYSGRGMVSSPKSELEVGAEFLEVN